MTVDLWGPEYYLKEGTYIAIRLCTHFDYIESPEGPPIPWKRNLCYFWKLEQFQTFLITVHGNMALKHCLQNDKEGN